MPTTDTDIFTTRLLDAPRAQVFQAFSNPAQLACWWGPDGFTNTIEKIDFRPEGEWHLTMHGPDGTAYPNESRFVEIIHNERIIFIHERPMHRFEMRMDYADENRQTRLTWRMRFDDAAECERVRPYCIPGNEQNLDRLQQHLKANR